MKRLYIIAVIATVVLVSPLVSAAFKLKLKKNPSPMVDYAAWVAEAGLPEEIEGIKQFYPVSVAVEGEDDRVDTVAVISGSIPVKGLEPQQILLAAMVYGSNHFDRENNEGFEAIDYAGMSFRMLLKSTQGSTSMETTYTRTVTVTARDGGFDFTIADIDCRYREKGLIPRTLRLEKLHPEKTGRHAEIVSELVAVNSAYLADLAEYVESRPDISSPNIDKVKKGAYVCKGMNADEVTILLGPPVNKRTSNDRERWIYSNDYIVIFTDGIVSKVVE